MFDTVLIADVYDRLQHAQENNFQVDVAREADGLKMLAGPLGQQIRRVAILPNDIEAIEAYRRAGFTVREMNGNRHHELIAFLGEEMHHLQQSPPRHLVVVTSDPAFALLCNTAPQGHTRVAIWSTTPKVPPELTNPQFDIRYLEKLLPGTRIKIARVAVFLDYENLHIGYQQTGAKAEPQDIIEAVRAQTADLGTVMSINAYAHWGNLPSRSGRPLPDELAALGVNPVYPVGTPGKNTADMKLASDIRTRVDRDPDDREAVETVVIGTRDDDLVEAVRNAESRGKKVVILALKEGLGSGLKDLAEVRFLEDHGHQSAIMPGPGDDPELFTAAMQVAVFLKKNRWYWSFANRLQEALGGDGTLYRRLVDTGALEPISKQTPHKLRLSLSHPSAFNAWWLVDRLHYCLTKRGMPFVDTNFLTNGVLKDSRFAKLSYVETRKQVTEALEMAAQAGALRKVKRANPNNPRRSVDTWWPAFMKPDREPGNQKPESPSADDTAASPVRPSVPDPSPQPWFQVRNQAIDTTA